MGKESDFSEHRGEHPSQDQGERETKGLGWVGPKICQVLGEGAGPSREGPLGCSAGMELRNSALGLGNTGLEGGVLRARV